MIMINIIVHVVIPFLDPRIRMVDTLSLARHVEQTPGFCHDGIIVWLMINFEVLLHGGDLMMMAAITCP